jgi:DNA-binding MarR family transcriptional regulator
MRTHPERTRPRGDREDPAAVERGEALFAELQRRLFQMAMSGALPLTRYLALACLERAPQPLAALGAELGIALSTVSELATRMAQDGLVTKSRGGDNARLVQIALTEEGYRALKQHRGVAREHHRARFAALPAAEQAAVSAALETLLRLLREPPRARR